MKFDLDTAWKDALSLLSRNRSLLAILAGVFFFLPYAGTGIAIPEMQDLGQAQAGGNFETMMAAMSALYEQYWWVFLLMAIIQGIGLLAMLALVRRRPNPTVGEALESGIKLAASYLAAQLLQTAILVLVAFLIIAISSVLGLAALAVLGGVVAFVVTCYLVTKFSLISPVIGIEGERNPVAAMRKSWALTRGNSMRLFFFYALLVIAFVVISAVISLVLGLVFAIGGDQTALFGGAVISGLINSVMIVLMVCILAAVHTQLSRMASSSTGGDAGD